MKASFGPLHHIYQNKLLNLSKFEIINILNVTRKEYKAIMVPLTTQVCEAQTLSNKSIAKTFEKEK